MCVETSNVMPAQILESAKQSVQRQGRVGLQNQLEVRAPELYQLITQIAFDELIERPTKLGHEADAAIYDAVWHAALVGIEAYRLAQPTRASVTAAIKVDGLAADASGARRVTESRSRVPAAAVATADLLVRDLGLRRAMRRLERNEPELAEYVMERLSKLYADLDRACDRPIAKDIHDSVVRLVLACIEAARRSS